MRWPLMLVALPTMAAAYGGKQPGERQLEALRREQQAVGANGQQLPLSEPQVLVVAAGCFWGVELAFARLPGVVSTDVGYTGGHSSNPTYRAVTRGDTMHAEAVRIRFDPQSVTMESLLDVFFDVHDPTTKNRQGNDVGTQYRSAIFYNGEDELIKARAALEREELRRGKKVATTIEPLGDFTRAEDYHQAYLEKGGQSAAKGNEAPIRCYG